jgi:hypothetical protein
VCAVAAFGPFSFIAASSAYGAVQESDPRDRSGNPQPNITEWSTARHQYYIYGDLCLRIKLSLPNNFSSEGIAAWFMSMIIPPTDLRD